MNIWGMCIGVVAAVVLLSVLRKWESSFAFVCEIFLVLVLCVCLIPQIKELAALWENMRDFSQSGKTSLKILLKVFSLLIAGSVTADICRDNSQTAVAGAVETGTKILALSAAMPLFSAVLELASVFLEK